MKIPDIRTCLTKLNIKHMETGTPWIRVTCPFHNDSKHLPDAHGAVSDDGKTFKCFKCGSMSSIVFLSGASGRNPNSVITFVANLFANKVEHISEELLSNWTELLFHSEEKLAVLHRKGLSDKSIRDFKLGLQAKGHIVIPVFDDTGTLIAMRRYAPEMDPKYKGIAGSKGTCLFNSKVTQDNETVYITEGELKAIVLTQYGFPAVSGIAGAGKWEKHWNQLFKDKHVVVIYDTDSAGILGANKVCRNVGPYAKSLKNVFLEDVSHIDGGDISDYFGQLHRNAADLQVLIDKTPAWVAPHAIADSNINLSEEEVTSLALADTSLASHFGKLIESEIVVSAKDTHPFIIPAKVEVKCPKGGHDVCLMCPVSVNPDKNSVVDIDKSSPRILDLVNSSSEQIKKILKKVVGIPDPCSFCRFSTIESHNVEEIRAIPQLSIGHNTAETVVRRIFSVGHGLATNSPYKIKARSCVDPNSQHATLVCYETEAGVDNIDTFTATEDLKIFQPYDWSKEGIEAKLEDLYEDLVCNVTKIFNRNDMHLFIDLVYHSALYIPFQGKYIKGWVDALIIGDSGQGKSEASNALRAHYKCGERIDTKQSSVAGIVGGVQETNKRWFITWGTIPLNDRRLVILEEVKGMPAESFGKLTDMRSSGIAEIVKIERARTNARTRLLWISNPRSGKPMGTYNYGVDAIKELVGSLEDIRRYDMAMAVSSGEVDISVINAKKRDRRTAEHYHTSAKCEQLVLWAWSRTEEQIEIPEETENEILDAATRLGKTYSSSCPLVEPSDQRLKIVRLATALAARTFSVDDNDEETLVVRPGHVKVVEEFLNRIYRNRALGYYEYSLTERGETELTRSDEIEYELRTLPNGQSLVSALLVSESISHQDIIDYCETDKDIAMRTIGMFARNNAIKRLRRGGYRKTQSFIELLKKLERIPSTEYKKEYDVSLRGI